MTIPFSSSDSSTVATPVTLVRTLYLRWSAVDRGWKASAIGLAVLGVIVAQP